MVRLFIGSMSQFAGKSLLSIGLGKIFKNKGLRIGYIKPLGKDPVRIKGRIADSEAVLIKDALELEDDYEMVSPFVFDFEMMRRAITKKTELSADVIKAIKEIKGRDIVLIEGASNIFDGSIVGANALDIVKAVNAKVLMVEPWKGEDTINEILGTAHILGKRFIGAVINMVPPVETDYLRKTVKPFLRRKGVNVFGVIKKDTVLGSVSIRQLKTALNGKVLCCENRLDELVEHYLVGAMDVSNALKYFRRTPNKAVLTGGHRSDIQLAALETSTKCLILTGGIYSNDVILSRAEATGVPVISVNLDTFSAVKKIESTIGKTHLKEPAKLKRAYSVVRGSIDFKALSGILGLHI
ncbi:phosphate acetyltransferase [bacterium BMS3Abin07]|nr:phosphate acetyltransferase [bacterium BMS3Abin07]GBE31620.1 phosphate acetyltransferase [bacterium BMS3Bbin05]HDL19666.1 phosphotransacetylase family protein [Nitrospirota bacterium]HDO21898.1 phosphotransacetylase family protein [Nitrospirota bacterium]HDZ87327.1 phosphotransacetylase family protein [Nitrospirota bacterium]